MKKNRKQNLIIYFILIGLFIVLLFAAYILRSLKITRKQKQQIEEQKVIVEEQKHIVEHQKHMVEEKQTEIMDSIRYAKRIQQALLPTEKYIDKSFKRLIKK